MDPITILTIARVAIGALNEGVPVVEKIIALVNAHGDAEAKALLPELEAAYAASQERRDAAHAKLQAAP